jgi:hypothetical protein
MPYHPYKPSSAWMFAVPEYTPTYVSNNSMSWTLPFLDHIPMTADDSAVSVRDTQPFNWKGLPTEIKENVIDCCISSITAYEDKFHDLPALPKLSARAYRERPRCEVVQKLGDWKYLLLASAQIRAITLRLCFNGSNAYPKGLCISADHHYSFSRRLRNLDHHQQLLLPNSVARPRSRASYLAHQYKKFPKMYPNLERFATFKHGIRKICLQFDFLSYIYFFKVTTSGIDYWKPQNLVTCDVFDQLPNLNEIVIDLPTEYDHRSQRQAGPRLDHADEPCPRALLRQIYERIAIELASFKEVKVLSHLDDEEEQRYRGLRESAILRLKFTSAELQELYADDGGGIELDADDLGKLLHCTSFSKTLANRVSSYPALSDTGSQAVSSTLSTASRSEEPKGSFFPPRCQCSYPCRRIFAGPDVL